MMGVGALTVIDVLRCAQEAVDAGDQGDAQVLLSRALHSCMSAMSEPEALAIATAGPDAEVNERARSSASALAECFGRMGDHGSAAQTYAWILSADALGFTQAELAVAARAKKGTERSHRRAVRKGGR
jgi:exopolyphosphatase/pppGpp-phosphohydrolase